MSQTDPLQALLQDPSRNQILDAFKPTELELFLFTYLQDDLLDPTPVFHRSLLEKVDGELDLAIEAPRGTGKSVLLTKGYPAYSLCTGRSKDVLLMSASFPEAQRRIKILKYLFESNELMRATFDVLIGKEFGGAWSNSHLEMKIRGLLCTVLGRGMTSQVRGFHPDLVVIDDPEETEGAKSSLVRGTVFDVYTKSVIPTRNPKDNAGKKAKIILIGTPINAEVLIHKAYTNFDGRFENFDRLCFPIIEDGNTTSLTGVRAGESIFPARFPIDYLEKLRAEMGPRAFSAEYLCHPVAEGSQVFYDDFFTGRYDHLPEANRLYSSVFMDPAKTMQDAKRGSETAIIGLSVERGALVDPYIYVRAAKIAHMPPRQRMKEAIYMAQELQADKIYIEDLQRGRGSNAGPSDYCDLCNAVLREMGLDHKIMAFPYLPVGDKMERAQRNVPACEQGRVLFPKKIAGHLWKLYQQMILFPNAEHEDGVDAFTMGLEILKNYKQGQNAWPDRKSQISRTRYLGPGRVQQGTWSATRASLWG